MQSAYICYEQQKMGIIKHLFSLKAPQRVIVFASSKLKVKDLAIVLRRSGYNVGAMHSDLQQAERDEVMYKFKAQQIDVLVATDIVARGIDIDDIQLVINYDVPHDAEDYVHRIGRTARANNEGEAVTFVGEMEQIGFAAIERFLEVDIEKKSSPEELGDAPLYDPKKNAPNHKKRRNNKRTNYKSKSSNIQHKKGDNKRFHRQNKKKE